MASTHSPKTELTATLGSLHQHSLEPCGLTTLALPSIAPRGVVGLVHLQCCWALSSEWGLDTYVRSCDYHIAPSARAH